MSTDGGATVAGDTGLDRAEVERQLADDRAEAIADELRGQWEDGQRAEISGDPRSREWWWRGLAITAAAETPASSVLVAIGEGGPEVLPRADAIALRDFLTWAIEGTLPPYEPETVALLKDGEEPF